VKTRVTNNLDDIFRCSDQSALIDNYITNHDPPPGAWSHQSEVQSALGRVTFPLVMSIFRGEVYTRDAKGKVVEEMLDRHEWVPWGFDGRNDTIRVSRSIGRDVWHARVSVMKRRPALLLMECAPGSGMNAYGGAPPIAFEQTTWGLQFKWEDRFEMHLRFAGTGRRIRVADDPATLRRIFSGFEDVALQAAHQKWAWSFLKRCWIGVEFSGLLNVTFAVGRIGRVNSTGLSTQRLRRQQQKRWEDFFSDLVPPIRTDDPIVRDTYHFAWQTIWANRCAGGSGMTPKPFTSPARLHYGAQWWWDDAFTSVILRHLRKPGAAYEFLENFRLAQYDDGMIPGYLGFTMDPRRDGHDADRFALGMQPPVIGFILQLLREKPGWPRDLRPLYDMLRRHAKWHDLPIRDTDGDGLVEYHHCNDTGLDQSPRWDAQKLDSRQTVGALRPIEAVDFNVWTSVLWDVLGDMAEQLGNARAASAHRNRAQRMMKQIDELMWDEADGIYYDIDAKSHRKIKVKTPFAFMVMLSRHARRDRCERMVREHLTNPREFWCRHPLPSCSMDDPRFNPIDMWRGPTWVNCNWMVIEGLERQEFHHEARQLARKTIELVGPRYDRRGRRLRSPQLFEWYHPHTGEPLGNAQYSWSALVIDLILRFHA
jgi:hypothetical protein